MDTTLQAISFVIVIVAIVLMLLSIVRVIAALHGARRRAIAAKDVLPTRHINAYDELPQISGLSVEADRPLLLSTGGASIGGDNTMVALAGLELLYHATSEVSIGGTVPIYLTSDTSVIPLGYDTLARAYRANGRPLPDNPIDNIENVRWYPSSERSLVFAAMLIVTMHSDQVTGNVLVGRFGSELGLVLGAAQRKNLKSIAGSDEIVGQAVAYVMADGALIGEDIFSAPGYLSNRASDKATLLTQDALRTLIIIGIIGVAISTLAGDQLASVLGPLVNALGG